MFKLKLALALVCICLLCSCHSKKSLESRKKAVVKRYVDENLNGGGDLSTAHEIVAPDYTFYRNGEKMSQRGVDVESESTEQEVSRP